MQATNAQKAIAAPKAREANSKRFKHFAPKDCKVRSAGILFSDLSALLSFALGSLCLAPGSYAVGQAIFFSAPSGSVVHNPNKHTKQPSSLSYLSCS